MKTTMLYELPIILFHQLIKSLEIKEVKELLYAPQKENNKYRCKYVSMPKDSENEKPTLVLLDLRNSDNIVEIVKILLLSKPPQFNDVGEVKDFHTHASVEVKASSYAERPMYSKIWEISVGLDVNMVYLGVITIGSVFSRFSNLYSLDLVKMADELYYSEKYNWITMYQKNAGKITSLKVRDKMLEI